MSEKNYGPNTAEVDAYLALLPKLTGEQWAAARDTAWAAASSRSGSAACDATWDAAWDATRAAAWDAAWHAALDDALDDAWVAAQAAVALVTRDLITPEHFDILTAPLHAAGIDFDALTTGSEEQEQGR